MYAKSTVDGNTSYTILTYLDGSKLPKSDGQAPVIFKYSFNVFVLLFSPSYTLFLQYILCIGRIHFLERPASLFHC